MVAQVCVACWVLAEPVVGKTEVDASANKLGKNTSYAREDCGETHCMPGRIVIWSANDFEETGEKREKKERIYVRRVPE